MVRLGSLVLIVAVAAGAYFTRPTEAAQRAAANAVLNDPQSLSEGVQGLGATLAGDRVFNDYYVVTRYTVNLNAKPVVDCWGAFTKVSCNRVKTSAQATPS
jgi:hypothetical protein